MYENRVATAVIRVVAKSTDHNYRHNNYNYADTSLPPLSQSSS